MYKNLAEIIASANQENTLSLCLFKPSKFLHVYFESKDIEELTTEEKKAYKNANLNLFEHNSNCEVEFKAMPSLPYSIKLEFEDDEGKKSKMGILDWEISQLYWNLKCSRRSIWTPPPVSMWTVIHCRYSHSDYSTSVQVFILQPSLSS
jgi:hypothetical protein